MSISVCRVMGFCNLNLWVNSYVVSLLIDIDQFRIDGDLIIV